MEAPPTRALLRDLLSTARCFIDGWVCVVHETKPWREIKEKRCP